MATIEPYCDSDEEVFFGPVTEKERLIHQALIMSHQLSPDKESEFSRYVGGDEGLHALAEAASMLSLSSEKTEVKEENVIKETIEEIDYKDWTLLQAKDDCEMINGNRDSVMEFDSVKFLTEHIPEQKVKYEVAKPVSECTDEMSQSPGVAHHTSLASSMDNSSCSFNNPVITGSPVDSFLVLEAQCKAEVSLESKSRNLKPICELEQLPPLNLSTTELADVGNKSDFEIKLSDNEEEREKVERNLKVEEIIKFLSDEDSNRILEERISGIERALGESVQVSSSEIGSSHLNRDDGDLIIDLNDNDKGSGIEKTLEESVQICSPEINSKLNVDDDIITIDLNDDELVDSSEGQCHEIENSIGATEMDAKYHLNNTIPVTIHEEIEKETCLPEESVESDIPSSIDDFNKDMLPNDIIIDHDYVNNVKIKVESTKEPVMPPDASMEMREEDQTSNEDAKVFQASNLTLNEDVNLSTIKDHTLNEDVKTSQKISEERIAKEITDVSAEKEHDKETSLKFNDALVTHRRLKTPSKVLSRLVHGSGSANLHKQPVSGDTKRHHGTPSKALSRPVDGSGSTNLHKHMGSGDVKRHLGPLQSPHPVRSAIPAAKTPMKGMSSTPGTGFKTPNSKTHSSKIPQALHPVSPSPRKNKYADIMSPVAQYIHGKSALLITNKNALGFKSGIPRKPIKFECGASEQISDSVDRGTENIDVNNVPRAPLPSNIYYKSAVPVKIFEPRGTKCQGDGPVVAVSKHIGRVKITSLKTGVIEMPLNMQCRESLLPDGEVSVLITKEMNVD